MADTIKLRRGTAAQWATANPVLADGEPGYDETNDQIRIGNGVAPWSGLGPLDASAMSGSAILSALAGSDGAGSGLDADLLDGQQGSAYATDANVVHTSGNETVAGTKTFSTTPVVPDNSWTLAKLANVTTARLLGRVTAGSGVPEELTAAQAKTLLALVKGDVGLGNADNTSDATKPISTATQSALDTKIQLGGDIAGTISSPTVPTAVKKGDLVFNVKDAAYGATGDGTTDDRPAIQAAINAAATAGGSVFFPAGLYRIASALTVTAAGVTLYGTGSRVSRIVCSAPPYLTVTGARFQMRDLGISHPGETTGNDLIVLTGAPDCVFERTLVDGSAATANFSRCITPLAGSNRCTIRFSEFLLANGATNRGWDCIGIQDSVDCNISHNRFEGGRQVHIDVRSSTGAAIGTQVIGNSMTGAASMALQLWNGYARVMGNRISNIGLRAIFLTGDAQGGTGGTTHYGSVVSGNVISNCTSGVVAEYDVHDCTISDNTLSGCAISLTKGTTDTVVSGNTVLNVTNNSYGSIYAPRDVISQNFRNSIVNNVVRNDTLGTLSGIYVEDGPHSFVSGNSCSNCAVGVTLNGTYAPSTVLGPNKLDGCTTPVAGNPSGATFSVVGTNPARSGAVRVPNNLGLVARKADDSADVTLINLTTGNNIEIPAGSASIQLRSGGGTPITLGTQIAIAENVGFDLGTTTGTKIARTTSQKLGFWNATPIVQPTTAVAASTFAANASAIANDTATFDGYTIGQVVKALRNAGLLA